MFSSDAKRFPASAKCFQSLSSAILFQFNFVLASRIARISFGFFERINKNLQRIGIDNWYALIDMPIFGANYKQFAKACFLVPVQHKRGGKHLGEDCVRIAVLSFKHRVVPAFHVEAKGHNVAKVNWLLHGLFVKGFLVVLFKCHNLIIAITASVRYRFIP